MKINFFKLFKKKIKQKKCDHNWKIFDSGYKQCVICKKIEFDK
jgi:hypothetical protein